MPRMIGLILLFGVSIAFIVLNLDNECDVSFGFRTFQNIPVFISVFASFVAGMVFALLLGFSSKRKKAHQPRPSLAKKPKKGADKNPKAEAFPELDKLPAQDGPYGID